LSVTCELRTKDASVQERVKKLIGRVESARSLSEIPNLKKLRGEGAYYRVRVGDYRRPAGWPTAKLCGPPTAKWSAWQHSEATRQPSELISVVLPRRRVRARRRGLRNVVCPAADHLLLRGRMPPVTFFPPAILNLAVVGGIGGSPQILRKIFRRYIHSNTSQ
jgi:hypothetical protein